MFLQDNNIFTSSSVVEEVVLLMFIPHWVHILEGVYFMLIILEVAREEDAVLSRCGIR